MKSVLACAGLALLGVDALRVEKRDNPAVIKIDLQAKTPPPARKIKNRQEVETPDLNYLTELLYIVQLQIGTPPQTTYVQLDTGSSDLIVETPGSDICATAPPNPCTNFGAYSPNASSTYEYIDSNFEVHYGGGDGATGDWVEDILSIGGAVLQGSQFGVMYKSTVLEGILGVSYPIIEGRNTFSGEPIYPNLPVLLVQQGYIASRAFSLYTNDDRIQSGGTLLFGGIDTNKFSGKLVTLDLVPSGFDGFSGVVDFTLATKGFSATTGGVTTQFSVGTINVLMDSGTTLTQLPSAIAAQIWTYFGAQPYTNSPNYAYIPCPVDETKTFNIEFQGITINVPLSQLAIDADGSGFCFFGISKTDGDAIIGDTSLTAMYVVYDLDNNQISLAPAVFGSTTENILQIQAGPGGVPDTSSSSSSIPPTSSTSSTTSTTPTSSPTTMTTTTKPTTTKPTTTVTPPPLKCNNNNCLNAMIHLSATASSFCQSYLGGLAVPTPTNIANGCSAVPSKISSGCSCIFSGTVPPPSTGPTPTTTATTTKPPTPLKCNMNNCLRAVENTLVPATFCPSYLAGADIAVPTNIQKGCATSASRISSACACVPT